MVLCIENWNEYGTTKILEHCKKKRKQEETTMKATNIKWDTDGDMELLSELPTELEIPEGMEDEEEISDYLTDVTGFCYFSFMLVR